MQQSRDLSQQNEGMVADGFSSEQQIYTKKNLDEQQKDEKQENEQEVKQKIMSILSPPQQIKSKAYSLLPDKVTGWGLKTEQSNPIPITFGNRYLDNLVNKMLANPNKNFPVVYLGPRYENTFYAWRDKPFKFPYSHINMPKNIKYKKRPFLGQNPEIEQSIYFDSIFESGNLDLAVQVNSHEYDLFVRVDSNTRGHFNWFNFVVAGMNVKEKYRFNICNLERGFCLYTRGMKPYMKSLRKKNDQWRQGGANVTYSKKQIRFARSFGFQPLKQWTLSFEIQTEEENDEIQISYCVPYTYSNMLKVIEELRQLYETKNILKQSTLCISLGGLPISLLTITQPQKQESPKKKKCIMVCGRVHPGQSNGSFMMEGFLKFICGDSRHAKNLRKYIVFKVVPMLNPDGVVLGNYRTGLSGKDFNREYRNPDKDIFPQVYFFKKLVTQMKLLYKNNLFMFLDLHGHSTKKNIFAYGPQFPIADKYYYQARIFAKMLQKQNKMFRYHSCVFKVSECKLATARAILLRKINIPLTYTIEASNGFYHDKELLISVPFVADQWLKMGASIAKTINEYVECMLSTQKIREDREKAKKQASKVKKQKLKVKSSSASPVKKQSTNNLITAKQDARIQKLYEQILRQQSQGPQDPNSDDNISQGSSDKQDDRDDLSKKQLQTLFSSIKNNNKLGKNKNKNGKAQKAKFEIQENQLDNEEEQVFQQGIQTPKPKFRIKNFSDVFDNINKPQEASQQVFIADKVALFKDKNKRTLSPGKHLSQKRNPNSHYTQTQIQNSSKIINYKFQQDKNKIDCLQTISIFPSFNSKNTITILMNERGNHINSPQKSHRSIIVSNGGKTPRSIKLLKNSEFQKSLNNVFGNKHKNQLEKKLQQIGLEKFQTNYSKFTRTGFYQKRQFRNTSISFTKAHNRSFGIQ